MPTSKVLYWNKPWPGHVGLIIDLDSGETTLGHMHLLAEAYGVSAHVTPAIPIGMTGLRNYVSWTAGSQKGNFVTGYRSYARTYEEDFMRCGGRAPKAADILGLDVDAAFEAWSEIRTKQGAHWKLLGKNCACVVLRVLRAAGCDQYVRNYLKRNPAVITPQAVWEYAKSAAHSTNGQIRHRLDD